MKNIDELSSLLQEYLLKNNIKDAKPKDLMPYLVQKGFFNKDHRSGLPLRKILRELDEQNMLHLIPQVRVERKAKNRYWFFNAINENIN